LELVVLSVYSMTSIAPLGQDTSHALQTMHSSCLTGTAFSSLISYTSKGHVSTHVPHPLHFSRSTFISTMIYLPLSLESKGKECWKIKVFGKTSFVDVTLSASGELHQSLSLPFLAFANRLLKVGGKFGLRCLLV